MFEKKRSKEAGLSMDSAFGERSPELVLERQ